KEATPNGRNRPSRAADTSTPLPCPSAQYAPPEGAAEYYARSQALGPGVLLRRVRDVSTRCPKTTGPRRVVNRTRRTTPHEKSRPRIPRAALLVRRLAIRVRPGELAPGVGFPPASAAAGSPAPRSVGRISGRHCDNSATAFATEPGSTGRYRPERQWR